MEQDNEFYNSIPEWKKKLIVLSELKKEHEKNEYVRQKVETNQLKYNNDWT